MGCREVLGAGRSFGSIREGRRSRPPRVSQLWVIWLVSTRHHWADIFIVRRQGPDVQKGSTNSTVTCSTWREMGSARLYFAQDSLCDNKTQPYHTRSVAAWVNKDRTICCTPGRRCQICYWCIIEDSRKRQHHIGTWNTRTLRAAGKLQKLTHKTDRYRWNILGLCEMRWKNFGETTTEEGHKVFFSAKGDKHEHGVGVLLFTRTP